MKLLANYKVIKYDNGEIEVYDELNGDIPKDIAAKIIEYFKKDMIKDMAIAKFELCGSLGVTAEDHLAIGSTPPKILNENPEKTELDIMSDEDIKKRLSEKRCELEIFSKEEYLANSFAQSYLSALKKDIKATLKFLMSKNRLPKEFETWKIDN